MFVKAGHLFTNVNVLRNSNIGELYKTFTNKVGRGR